MVYEEVDQRRVEKKEYRMFLDDYERDAIDAFLHRHERVLGVDAVRVEHVRVAAHRREERRVALWPPSIVKPTPQTRSASRFDNNTSSTEDAQRHAEDVVRSSTLRVRARSWT